MFRAPFALSPYALRIRANLSAACQARYRCSTCAVESLAAAVLVASVMDPTGAATGVRTGQTQSAYVRLGDVDQARDATALWRETHPSVRRMIRELRRAFSFLEKELGW
jgi:hypothetical protein